MKHLKPIKNIVLIQLRSCRDLVVYHQKIQAFFLRPHSCTAEISIPQESMPIIFLGGRLVMAMQVLPTSSSGS